MLLTKDKLMKEFLIQNLSSQYKKRMKRGQALIRPKRIGKILQKPQAGF